MKLPHKLSALIAASGLLLSANVQASMYDVVCVECSLTNTSYTLQDPSNVIDSGSLQFPNPAGDFDFDLIGITASAYNSSFYFLPGTYSFDSLGDSVTPAQTISMTVNDGQVGMHFLFDWNGNTGIDVLAVFDVVTLDGDTVFTPTDVDGNGIVGFAMVDGPWQGVDLAVGFTVATPLPAAFWLFGTGLIGLIQLGRRKKR